MALVRPRAALIAAKIALTAAVMYWLLAQTSLEQLRTVFGRIPASVLLAALLLHMLAFLLAGIRWWTLLRSVVNGIALRHLLPSYYLGIFFNNLLPSSMGGDAVRVLHLRWSGMPTQVLISSALVDRIIGLAAVLCMGASAALLAPAHFVPRPLVTSLIVLTTCAIVGLWLAWAPFSVRLLNRLAGHYSQTRIRRWLIEVAALCHAAANTRRSVITALLLSVALQSLVIAVYFLLARSIDIPVSFLSYFVVVPIVFLAASLPISVGGLGVREGVLVALLGLMGVDRQSAVNLSVVYLLVMYAASLPGALVLLLPSGRVHAKESSP